MCLDVALEHLERHRDRDLPAQEPLQDGGLEPVRPRIVVQLADEDHVSPRQIRKHRLEIGEGLPPRVVDALRFVAGRDSYVGFDGGRGLQENRCENRG